MKRLGVMGVVFFSILFWCTISFAIPVDLSGFIAEDDYNDAINDPTIVDIGTNTITFYEDEAYGFIYAANDAFFVSDNATILTYDYSLTPDLGDYDWLVTVLDYDYIMEIEQSGSGSFSIDMTPFQGETISLAFGLEYDWSDSGYGSVGIISNIDLAESTAPVPEPATLILLGSGLAGLFGVGRKRFLKGAS